VRQTTPRPVLDCGSHHDRNQPGGTLSEEQIRCREGQGRLAVGARPRVISIMPINAGPLPALDMNSNTVFIMPPLPLNRWKGKTRTRGKFKDSDPSQNEKPPPKAGRLRSSEVSGPVVIIFTTAVWARLSSPSGPPPLSVTLIFFVINQPPAGLVGLVQ